MNVVIITGGRTYEDEQTVFTAMKHFEDRFGTVSLLLEGGAQGADTLGFQWAAREAGRPVITVHALWQTEGKAAGVRRNCRMLSTALVLAGERGKVYVIHFPGGPGTADMVRRARQDHRVRVLDGTRSK